MGCFRDLVEITQWAEADDKIRLEILSHCEARKKAHEAKWGVRR